MEQIKNATLAILYLLWEIIKQQWKLILILMMFSLLFIPFPILFFSLNENYRMSSGFVSTFTMMPSLLVLLVVMPIVFSQVNSSSIKKRINSVGIPDWIFKFSIMLLFTLISILFYYSMIIITTIIFNSRAFYDHGVWENSGDPVKYIIYKNDIIWWMLLFITPISMLGISSLGIFISSLKAPDIAKGFIIFLIIIIMLISSRTILSPLDLAIHGEEVDGINIVDESSKRFYNILRYVNPWGNMLFVNEMAVSGKILTSYFDGVESLITNEGIGYAGDIIFSMSYLQDVLYVILATPILVFLACILK